MAFVTSSGSVISFAEYTDVLELDQRLFEVNEGLSDDVVEPLLERATQRILDRLRLTDWWRGYWLRRQTGTSVTSVADIPSLDIDRIQARQQSFTDLCVYVGLSEFILPRVADFGNEDSAERKKMGYYSVQADRLLQELVTAGDWYDFDDDGTVESTEKQPGQLQFKRVR